MNLRTIDDPFFFFFFVFLLLGVASLSTSRLGFEKSMGYELRYLESILQKEKKNHPTFSDFIEI